MVIPKFQHGAEGSKHYNAIMEMATKVLCKKFGVPKHKIVTPNGAEASLETQTKTLCIHNTIMDLLLCIQEGLHHCKQMNFIDILLVANFVRTASLDPRDRWNESETTKWTSWGLIDKCDVIFWQWCINKIFSKDDCTSVKWFLVNSHMP